MYEDWSDPIVVNYQAGDIAEGTCTICEDVLK